MRNNYSKTMLQPERVVADAGNAGAVVYGPYSFSVTDCIHSFVEWLNQASHPYGRILSKWSPGSREFSAAWMYLGVNDPQGFLELQEVFHNNARAYAS